MTEKPLLSEAAARAMAVYHEELAAGDGAASLSVSAVELGELHLVFRIQDCLQRLERVRREERMRETGAGDDTFAEVEPSAAADLEDERCIGRFEIEQRLSGGGQGIVFAAYDPVLKRRVALETSAP